MAKIYSNEHPKYKTEDNKNIKVAKDIKVVVPKVKFHAVGSEKKDWLDLRKKFMEDLDLSMGEAGEQATDELGYHIRDLK
jgi:hypothetical protein